jgi:thiol-disulfide isomerase/thioredoxin
LLTLGRGATLWGCFALLILVGLPARGDPLLSELVDGLKLSAYPSGWRPPPFAAATVAGRKVSLGDLEGRVVLLNFWATWCSSCLREMPLFDQLHREYARAGLTVLGVNIQEDEQTIRRYGEKLELSFPLILDLDGKITKAYGAIGIPSTYLIGRDGRAVALAVGTREWKGPPARALIETLLAEPPIRGGTR